MLSTEKARRLLRDVQFPGDEDCTYRIAVSGKNSRKTLINSDDDRGRQTAGAVEIQRIWRGFRTRQKYANITGRIRQDGAGRGERRHFPLLTRRYRDYIQWCLSDLGVAEGSPVVMGFRDYCARVIQVWWRTAAKIGGRGGWKSARGRVLTEQTAALKIQKAWKSYQNRKIFSFYRKLIDFRHQGDPSVLLKTINPLEAKLIDKASGACVRFRLGGPEFPPCIYYKIFTSQAVVDVCSYSPRDYTAMNVRRPLERDIHNHGGRRLEDDDGSSWYKRWENNGWRLVAQRLFQSQLQDPVTIETSVKRQPFHYSKLQRRADVERRRRVKKMAWMRKLYQSRIEGDQAPPTSDEVEEEEIDKLLEWTHGLNYEDYVSDWSQMATSAAQPPPSCDHHVTVM